MATKSQGAKSLTNASVEENVKQNKVVLGETNLSGGVVAGTVVSTESLLDIIKKLQVQVELLQTKENKKEETIETVAEKEEEQEDFESVKINQDDYIKVVSLTPFTLNLSTKAGGKGGKTFTFNGFGTTKRILYSDLVEILENFGHFLENGFFYIADKRVIRKNGLDEIYTKILSKEKIETILSGENNDVVISLFKSANEKQQGLIIQMLIDRRISGQEIDLNLWDKLNRSTDINMDEKYENTRLYVESLNVNKEK